jgi:hypothetical protein
MEFKMKENVWKKSFVAGEYKIKDLSLSNQLELSILSDELGKFWKFEGEKVSIDVEGIKAAMKLGELKDTLERSIEVLEEILDDYDFTSLGSYDIFFLIPDVNYNIKQYKESLKKK